MYIFIHTYNLIYFIKLLYITLFLKTIGNQIGITLYVHVLLQVSVTEYSLQKLKIQRLEKDLLTAENLFRTINMEHLPDKGQSIKEKYEHIENTLLEAVQKLSVMELSKGNIRFSLS